MGARPRKRGGDAPGRGWRGVQAGGSPLSRSTYCFKYASLLRGSARLSRVATARFRDEPS